QSPLQFWAVVLEVVLSDDNIAFRAVWRTTEPRRALVCTGSSPSSNVSIEWHPNQFVLLWHVVKLKQALLVHVACDEEAGFSASKPRLPGCTARSYTTGRHAPCRGIRARIRLPLKTGLYRGDAGGERESWCALEENIA